MSIQLGMKNFEWSYIIFSYFQKLSFESWNDWFDGVEIHLFEWFDHLSFNLIFFFDEIKSLFQIQKNEIKSFSNLNWNIELIEIGLNWFKFSFLNPFWFICHFFFFLFLLILIFNDIIFKNWIKRIKRNNKIN